MSSAALRPRRASWGWGGVTVCARPVTPNLPDPEPPRIPGRSRGDSLLGASRKGARTLGDPHRPPRRGSPVTHEGRQAVGREARAPQLRRVRHAAGGGEGTVSGPAAAPPAPIAPQAPTLTRGGSSPRPRPRRPPPRSSTRSAGAPGPAVTCTARPTAAAAQTCSLPGRGAGCRLSRLRGPEAGAGPTLVGVARPRQAELRARSGVLWAGLNCEAAVRGRGYLRGGDRGGA